MDAIAVQADGKIVVGGSFSTLGGGGMAHAALQYRAAQFGRLGGRQLQSWCRKLCDSHSVANDGEIIVAGTFTALGGGSFGTATPRNHIGRLDSNGTVDATFDPGADGAPDALVVAKPRQDSGRWIFWFSWGWRQRHNAPQQYRTIEPRRNSRCRLRSWREYRLSRLIVQPDGKILVAGDFTALGGGSTGTTTRNHLGRLLVALPVIISPRSVTSTVDLPFSYQFETIWCDLVSGRRSDFASRFVL